MPFSAWERNSPLKQSQTIARQRPEVKGKKRAFTAAGPHCFLTFAVLPCVLKCAR